MCVCLFHLKYFQSVWHIAPVVCELSCSLPKDISKWARFWSQVRPKAIKIGDLGGPWLHHGICACTVGSLFQMIGLWWENKHWPKGFDLIKEIVRVMVSTYKQSCIEDVLMLRRHEGYIGAVADKELKQKYKVLYWILAETWSHWRQLRVVEIWCLFKFGDKTGNWGLGPIRMIQQVFMAARHDTFAIV